MKSELKDQIERLVQDPGIDHARSGSPVDLLMGRLQRRTDILSIEAMRSLVNRGVALRRAKRFIETVMAGNEVVVRVPYVDDISALKQELEASGFPILRISTAMPEVKELRRRLGLTQEQFAIRFGLDIDAVQNWEQGRCQPDKATQSYLRVIAYDPKVAAAAQEEAVS